MHFNAMRGGGGGEAGRGHPAARRDRPSTGWWPRWRSARPETRERIPRASSRQRMQEVLENTQHRREPASCTEAAIFADKVAVDEETVRLRSHVDQLREMLTRTRPDGHGSWTSCIQEFNREANTIGSKCSDRGHLRAWWWT